MRCSASFMFANAAVDNCTMRVRKCIFSLLGRLTTLTNVIVQSGLNSDVYIPLRHCNEDGLRRYTLVVSSVSFASTV